MVLASSNTRRLTCLTLFNIVYILLHGICNVLQEFAMALVKARGEAKAKDVLALQQLSLKHLILNGVECVCEVRPLAARTQPA